MQRFLVHAYCKLPAVQNIRRKQAGETERFLSDLRKAVKIVQNQPEKRGGMVPVYGMAATLPFRGMVVDLLKRYIDLLYEV